MPITLSARSVRRVALAGAAATLSVVLAACGASFNAQTSQPYQPAEGTNAASGGIVVRNLLILSDADGKGEVHGVVVNNGAESDTLVSITQAPPKPAAADTPPEDATPVKFGEFQPLTLQVGAAVRLPQTGGTEPTPTTTPSTTPSTTPTATPKTPATPAAAAPFSVTGGKPGEMVSVVITFGKAGPITADIPILPEDHYSPSPRNDAEAGH
ncbi:hypothetical protein ABZS29_34800 [Kribbella sp. NPDC005582]|uniref:hypothetical protein n=1 Tax=Kribbella sp. NPDC005582 TaxID=3156893 RepID=UPI0033A96F8A